MEERKKINYFDKEQIELQFKKVESENIANRWKLLSNCDYITLFIKTWFAFISSIKTILKFKNEDLIRGDRVILKKYQQSIAGLIRADYLELEIEEYTFPELYLYKEGIKVLAKKIPYSLFSLFYQINENTNIKVAYANKQYIAQLRLKNSDKKTMIIKIFVRVKQQNYQEKIIVDKKLFRDVFDGYVKSNMNFTSKDIIDSYCGSLYFFVKEEIDRVIDNKNVKDIINKLNESLYRKNTSIINRMYSNFKCHKNKYIDDEQIIFLQKPLFFFDEYDLYEKLSYSLDFYKNGNSIIEWEIDFLYTIRNFLFHGIIDPFDENWQNMLKYAYLTLKILVDFNSTLFSSLLRNKNMFKKSE